MNKRQHSAHPLLCRAPSQHEHYDRILERIQEHPEEARQEANADTTSSTLPLPLLLKSDPPLEVVTKLVEAYPEAVYEENGQGYLPLHVALRYGTNVEVVKFLIDQNPQAVHRSAQGYFSWNLPELAHYLWSGGQGMSCTDMVKALPEDHPHRAALLELIENKNF